MTTKLVRHQRIVNLRNMALQGATIPQLKLMCKKLGLSKSATDSYIDEVVESIRRRVKKI